MASASSSSLTLIFAIFAVAAVINSVSAKEYLVGGVVVGWQLPAVNETKLYNVWASRRRFHVGDSLRFRYKPVDSVVVVGKWPFYHCDPRQPIASFHNGDTLINLDKADTMYFITGDASRCKQGINMMVEVSVVPEKPPSSVAPSPSVSNMTENPYSSTAPSPSELLSPEDAPELSPALSPSDSVVSFAVTRFVTALILGIGLWAVIGFFFFT